MKTLFDPDKLLDFFPNKYQSYEERVNALARLIIYAGVSISLYRKHVSPLLFSIGLLVVLIIISKVQKNLFNGRQKRHNNPSGCQKFQEDCQKPTVMNPFANVLVGDNPERKHACPVDEVEEDIVAKFNRSVIKSEFDVFDNQNSQRQFYSTPNTSIPNDQGAFAHWLYGQDKVCKSNPVACTGFDG